ncbi:hypothetical protein [Paraburkholderia nemoris]|uniref:hypothetical protein n=1 Tax=Paraburkholderia nemoris TaxID=2793076 RepID=UPI0019093D7A|nr:MULTISPECIES: hypothetical protein [Paraburkholderia]MBK3815251.1 hypothetical protein [Paraburkholderia aspalathi]
MLAVMPGQIHELIENPDPVTQHNVDALYNGFTGATTAIAAVPRADQQLASSSRFA